MAPTISASRASGIRNVGFWNNTELVVDDWHQFLQQTDDVSSTCCIHKFYETVADIYLGLDELGLAYRLAQPIALLRKLGLPSGEVIS